VSYSATICKHIDFFCIGRLQKKYHIHIDTGDTFHVHSKKHNVDDDDLMITVIAVLSFVFDKAK